MEGSVYLNGAMIPPGQAKISAFDYGFLYGFGLFETMRSYNGNVFRLDSHLARLAESANTLGIRLDPSILKKAVMETLQANGLKEARVRLAVSIGEGSIVPDLSSCNKPTVLVVAAKYTPHTDEIYQNGVKVIISSIRRNTRSPLPAMKTANYMESLLARKEAKTAAVDEALFLNEKGYLAEAGTSNVFLVSNGTLQTPSLASAILPGITRVVVLELASRLGIAAHEADITLEEILAADEVFLTNSIIEVMPVMLVDGKKVGSGKPGLITRQLMSAYKDLVLEETGQMY